MISRSRPDSVGGGVVAETFRGLQKPARFSGGGGGSSRNFPWSPEAGPIQWGGGGGVVAEIFRDLQTPARFSGGGGSSRHFFSVSHLQKPTRLGRGREILTTHSLISRDIHESISQASFARHVHQQKNN